MEQTHQFGAAWDTEEGRANILSFDPEGKNQKIVAAGLRNPPVSQFTSHRPALGSGK